MQMFAYEEAHRSLRAHSGRDSYLKGISGWKHRTEVATDHNIWHLQNEMLYLSAPWKPLFPANPYFYIWLFPAQCHRTDSAVLNYHIIFFYSADHKWLNARSHHFDSLLKHLKTYSYHLLTAHGTLSCHCIYYTALAYSPHSHVQPHAPIQPLLFPWLTEDAFGQSVASTLMLEMTMGALLTGQEDLLVWKAFLAFYYVIWFDISGQTLDRNKVLIFDLYNQCILTYSQDSTACLHVDMLTLTLCFLTDMFALLTILHVSMFTSANKQYTQYSAGWWDSH